ncbi:MAG TPA: hypothetical protein VGL92_01915, partial [Acidimicrobiia bacterium]
AAVPEVPVSPPPARPNPLGHLLSLVDVEATFTGLPLPRSPEAPRTGVGPIDRDRPQPVPDRPGRRVWDASQERAEASWTAVRRQGHEMWSDVRGR